MNAPAPVLMIGLDAADAAIVDRLVEAGKMPILAGLRASGLSGRLRSPAARYAGAVWPGFYTGQDVPWHGIYHNKLWRPRAMRCEVPTDAWLASRPFWELPGLRDLRACIMDVPMVLGRPRPINGIYLGGWGTHDLISRGSWPASLWSELKRAYGPPIMPAEQFGLQSVSSLMRLRAELLRSTDQARDVALDLLRRERWDFSCIVFGGIHRMGHYLTNLSQLNEESLSSGERAILGGAVDEIYQATDTAIGRLLEHVTPGTLVIAFAVHGMGPNPGWGDLTADILREMQRASTGRVAKTGLLYGIKRRVPMHWVRPVLGRLPMAVTDRLVSMWSAHMQDWKSARYFPMPMDHAAYLRVNRRGRERDGIVDELEYAQELGQLEAWFGGLRDRDSSERLASEVVHAYADASESAIHRDLLPDLVIPWGQRRSTQSRELVCDALPSLRYEVPARLPSGRSGNHLGRGWFVANGPEVCQGIATEHDILDLAPTVLHHLGVEHPPSLQGRRMELVRARN